MAGALIDMHVFRLYFLRLVCDVAKVHDHGIFHLVRPYRSSSERSAFSQTNSQKLLVVVRSPSPGRGSR